MPPDSAVKTATAPIVITARTTPYSAIVWPSSLRQCVRRSSNHSENVMLIHLPSYSLARADRRTTKTGGSSERIDAANVCTAHAGRSSVVRGRGRAAIRFNYGEHRLPVRARHIPQGGEAGLVPSNEGVRAGSRCADTRDESARGRGSSDDPR